MQTKAKLEVGIAALGAEVRELARRRGRALPALEDGVGWLQALAVTGDDVRALETGGESDEVAFGRLVTRGQGREAAEARAADHPHTHRARAGRLPRSSLRPSTAPR